MTRSEYLKFCKERAILEFDFYAKTDGIDSAVRNGLTSMMSDMNKHPETRSPTIDFMCMSMMLLIKERAKFVDFINGFN